MARPPNIATGVGNTNPRRRPPNQFGPIVGGVRWNLPWLVQHTGKLPGFTPYRPPPVPTGSYDPALDAQQRAARRGYGDTQQDIALGGTRAAEDFGLGQYAIGEQTGNVNADYQRNVGLLTKHYQDVAAAQNDQANAAGVVPGGGAYLQAQAKRAGNQASEQAGLGLAHQQALQQLQDQLGQLGVTYERGVTDRTSSLTRAGRENTAFGLDVQAEKAYQAGQSGYIAPGRGQPGGMPANERIVHGQHVRTVTVGGVRYTYGPNGRIISKKRVK